LNNKEIIRLARMKDFGKVWSDKYFQENFVKKYAFDLPRLAFEVFGVELTYQQIDVWNAFMDSGGFKGGRLAVPSGHGTGKTKLIGVISSMHLLCFKNSITRIQAPTLKQVKTSSFKEISSSLRGMEANRKVFGKVYKSEWGFLLNYIQINKEVIYIKGYDTSWYIEAKTAPKGDSTNLSGQHQLNFLLVLDEASGIEDEHIEASLGALTEEYNSCITFSQHTRKSGKFHNFVTTLSKEAGGIWQTIRLSSRYSPRVSKEQLKTMLETYTEEEIRVRIDGLPPKKENGMLISQDSVIKAYMNKESVFKRKFNTIIFSYDIGYTGYRDSSVLVISEAISIFNDTTNKEEKFYKIKDIQRYTDENGVLPTEFTEKIVFREVLRYLDDKSKNGIYYDNIHIIGDASAGGYEAFVKLEDKLLQTQSYNFQLKGLQWGAEKLYFEDKKRFINARAKAFVYLENAFTDNRILIETEKFRNKFVYEAGNIPYTFTSTLKYKILGKDEMSKRGISSPDIADTIAQIMLVNFESVRDEFEFVRDEQKEQEIYEDLEELPLEDEFFKEDGEVSSDLLPKVIGNYEDEF